MTPIILMKALADDTRLNIVSLLTAGTSCVCDLTDTLQISQPKMSRHLALLREVGLVSSERRGQWMFYSLADNLPDWALSVIQSLAATGLCAPTHANINSGDCCPSC